MVAKRIKEITLIHSFDVGTVYVDEEYGDVMLCVAKTNARYSINEDTGRRFEPMLDVDGYYDMLLLSVGNRRASLENTVEHVHVSSTTATYLMPLLREKP